MAQIEKKNRTFAIHTLGCKVNTYESDVISGNMLRSGFSEVPFDGPADIYIVNTCTVTNIADRKSRQMLHRARKENPSALIIATGCYVDAVEQGRGLPESEVDLWVGNRDKSRLADLCKEALAGKKQKTEPEDGTGKTAEDPGYDSRYFLTELDGHTRAFVKIEDGCGMYCTYCIIPYVRGKVVSRPVEETVREIEGLSAGGVKEVVLTGIHLSSMGMKLLETLKEVNRIPGIERVRLGSLEPRFITPRVVEELKSLDKLCPHFHLSLQSGSNEVLKKMNRRYSAEEFLDGCRVIRAAWPDAAITTDIIVGFPGETEENFEETLAFAKEAAFYEPHVFKYSRRKGTRADTMPGQQTESVKAERSRKLIGLGEELSHAFRTRFLGRKTEFLAEEEITLKSTVYITGYTREYIRCILPAENVTWKPGDLLTGKAVSLIPDRAAGELLVLSDEN